MLALSSLLTRALRLALLDLLLRLTIILAFSLLLASSANNSVNFTLDNDTDAFFILSLLLFLFLDSSYRHLLMLLELVKLDLEKVLELLQILELLLQVIQALLDAELYGARRISHIVHKHVHEDLAGVHLLLQSLYLLLLE